MLLLSEKEQLELKAKVSALEAVIANSSFADEYARRFEIEWDTIQKQAAAELERRGENPQ